MNIIIEGPDATGKTTLVNKILKKNNLATIHGTAKTPNDFNYYCDLLSLDNQIFDRFHLSEYIFPQIYGRLPKLTYNNFEELNKRIIETNTYYILFITSNMKILEDRLIERGETNYLTEIYDQNDLFKLFGEYFNIKNHSVNSNYDRFYIIDIAKDNAYDKLDDWLRKAGIL